MTRRAASAAVVVALSVVFVVTLLARAGLLLAADVRNVTAQQRPGTKVVDIRYDLDGPTTETVGIVVKYDLDGGAGGYPGRATSVSGDAGSGIIPGPGKHIVWHAEADVPVNQYLNARVKVFIGLSVLPPSTGIFEENSQDLTALYEGSPYGGALRWSVDGVENGNSEAGTIQSIGGGQARYTAPALSDGIRRKKVTITAETTDLQPENFTGTSKITVSAKFVAVSTQVSFLNALPSEGSKERAALSPMTSYLNALPAEGSKERAALSPMTSYLNAVDEGERFQASPVVSYENQE